MATTKQRHQQRKFWPIWLLAPLFSCLATYAEEPSRAALAVEIATVSHGAVTELIFADGNSRAQRREFLLFENSGRVAFLKTNDAGGPLREGDKVTKGELLAELDRRIDDASTRAARAELDTVRAALTSTRDEYERTKHLKDTGVIPASQFNEIESAYKQALANVRAAEARADQAKAGLRQLQLRAPFDGVVSFVNIREGQYVSPSQFDSSSEQAAVRTSPIVIIDPTAFEIIIELPVVDGRRVKAGQNAFILDEGTLARVQQSGFDPDSEADNVEDLMIPARVGSVSPAIDPGSRAVRARVVTNEMVEGMNDGGYVTVWIEVERRENAVLTPLESLVFRGDKAYTFVVDSTANVVERRELTLGLTGYEGVEVLSGLEPDEVVVTKGRFRLSTGMPVRQALPIGGEQ